MACARPQLEGQVVALLVQNMERLDEQAKEEADGIHNTLGKRHSTLRARSGTSFFFFVLLSGPMLYQIIFLLFLLKLKLDASV